MHDLIDEMKPVGLSSLDNHQHSTKCIDLSHFLAPENNKCDPTRVNEADVVRGPNCDFAVNVFYRIQESI